jgi:hypothetical protein
LSEKPLEKLSDMATEAHTRIQKDFENINPVIGLSQRMRAVGIPADAMTIDCLKTGKRIIIVLHDQQPEILQYQFSFKAQDPTDEFETLDLSMLSTELMYEWMRDYFLVVNN